MKDFLKGILVWSRPLLIIILSAFFSRRYLRSRHFEAYNGGFFWAARAIWARNILRLGRTYPWPVALGCTISNPENIRFDPDDLNNFQMNGTYFQNFSARIVIGKGCYIAPNVGIITANHDQNNLDRHLPGNDVILGQSCWVGMNSIILPGVVLGSNTIVAAGSVVVRSCEEGNVVLAGSPAKVVKKLFPSREVHDPPSDLGQLGKRGN
jgi:transferase family hexapeptide repeat protein